MPAVNRTQIARPVFIAYRETAVERARRELLATQQ